MVGKEAIDDEGVEGDDEGGEEARDDEGERDGDPFMDGIGILDGDVVERKVLGEGGDELVERRVDGGEDSGNDNNQISGR